MKWHKCPWLLFGYTLGFQSWYLECWIYNFHFVVIYVLVFYYYPLSLIDPENYGFCWWNCASFLPKRKFSSSNIKNCLLFSWISNCWIAGSVWISFFHNRHFLVVYAGYLLLTFFFPMYPLKILVYWVSSRPMPMPSFFYCSGNGSFDLEFCRSNCHRSLSLL